MTTVIVVYFSGTGVTERLAKAICEGASTLSKTVAHRIEGSEIVDGRFRNEAALKLIDSADAVVFGSPTYLGGPAAQFKAFADATGDRWSERKWGFPVSRLKVSCLRQTFLLLNTLAARCQHSSCPSQSRSVNLWEAKAVRPNEQGWIVLATV